MKKKYTVDIQGMHCGGCTRLVSIGLAEQELQDVSVDMATQRASFASDEDLQAVQAKVGAVASELSDYKFGAVKGA
jgi:copper chaperone CopZ